MVSGRLPRRNGEEVRLAERASPRLADLAEVRDATYRLFGSLLLGPTDSKGLEPLLDLAAELRGRRDVVRSFPFFPSWRAALDALELAARDGGGLTEERVRLFQLGGAPCPPYEAAYLDPSGFERGAMAVAVERVYAEAGVSLSPSSGELPDHGGLELEFMSLLCAEEATAWRAADTVQAQGWLRREAAFLDGHLLRWFPSFARDVRLATGKESFYGRLAEAIQALVVHDRDLAGALLERRPAASEEA